MMDYNHNNYADIMWKQFNPKAIIFDNMKNEQIFEFAKWEKYMIEWSMSELQNYALALELISDEENNWAIPMLLLVCKNDLLGREYCHIVTWLTLRSKYLLPTQVNEVVDYIECILIDPYNKQNTNRDCWTVTRNQLFIRDQQMFVPELWSHWDNTWRLLINPWVSNKKGPLLPIKLLVKKL